MSKMVFRIGLLTSASLVIIGMILTLTGQYTFAKYFLLIGLPLMAISFQGYHSLKSFSFTIWIFTAVTCSLYYPHLFTGIGDFSFRQLIVPLLQLIMFGVGSTMGIRDFAGVAKMPKGVLIGIVSQFTIMPLVGFALARIFNFPAEIAAGIILVGCSPSGLASNVMSYIANANVALSVTLTAIATLLAPIITPFLMQQLAGEYVAVDFITMMIEIIKIVIVPIGAGLLFNHFLGKRFPRIMQVMPLLSIISIAVIITIITAAGRDSLLTIGPLLVVACLIHNIAGYSLGYGFAKLLRMDEKSCRTIAL
ncbi:MAG: bile acid:sodium symporter family protein, partial [Cyclobacteriaceae bacterium]|nr:bile acid:sodium symporter family protein [Cyclobacteriaceae bacterium]